MTAKRLCHVVVAIDGPAGVGKSTVAKRLAHYLGYHYVDSGAMYRAVGWLVQSHGLSVQAPEAVMALLARTSLRLVLHDGQCEIWINGQPVTDELRSETVGSAASAVATLHGVRQLVTAQLRQLGCQGNLVMEGRDIGTVVFPDATVKFFLEASLDVRGQRRLQELQQDGAAVTQPEVTQAIAARDWQDRTRAEAPLTRAAEAHVIDTTNLTVDDVSETMLSEIQRNILQDDS